MAPPVLLDPTSPPGALRIGTFIKTPTPHIVELLEHCGLDFAIIDAEHGPFDRGMIDLMMLAGRAAQLPLFVRLRNDEPSTILEALDLGARGIVVPHVETAEQARAIVRAARYLTGKRGFSNGSRAAGYGGQSTSDVVRRGNEVEIICQVESVTAISNAAEIAAVSDVSALMIGRADLAFDMGTTDVQSNEVGRMTLQAIGAARAAGKTAAIVGGEAAEIDRFVAAGTSMIVISSDQTLLRKAAALAVARVRELRA